MMDKKEYKIVRPKFAEVYRAICDTGTEGVIIYSKPASSGFDCILPKSTLIVIENDPPKGAGAVYAIPLNYKKLEKELVPQAELNSSEYDMYGLTIYFEQLQYCFVKENIVTEQIQFDDEKIQSHWQTVCRIRKIQQEKSENEKETWTEEVNKEKCALENELKNKYGDKYYEGEKNLAALMSKHDKKLQKMIRHWKEAGEKARIQQ